jgi:ribosomal protein L24
MNEKYVKGDVVKVVGGKYKGSMGVVVRPTEKMYYIRLDSHEEVRLMASSVIKERKGDNWENLKCTRESNVENGDGNNRVIDVAEKIGDELCLIRKNLEAVVELLKLLNVNI